MEIRLLQIGNTTDSYLKEGISEFEKRLKHYTKYSSTTLSPVKISKNLSASHIMQKEAELINKHIDKKSILIVLDEKGKHLSSEKFADFIQKKQVLGCSKITFIIGGAFGISPEIKEKASLVLSLSDMTFTHQMVRLFFIEQVYRAFTIIRNEKYHNS